MSNFFYLQNVKNMVLYKRFISIFKNMIYTNKYINLISLIITIIIFSILNLFFIKTPEISEKEIPNIISKIDFKKEEKNIKTETEIPEEELEKWYVEIPKINLKAPIAEGTEKETLDTKIGHFTETGLTTGNVGLAGHNRGYEYNYFENLKKLKKEDEIIYKYLDYKETYKIDKIEIIKNTDWSYLNNTEENKITLITCVENEPQYRRCIQAVQIEN